jgi:hypothetical protein
MKKYDQNISTKMLLECNHVKASNILTNVANSYQANLARIFHESPAATTDMAVLPGVLGTNTLRLPGGTLIFVVSRQQFMKYPG